MPDSQPSLEILLQGLKASADPTRLRLLSLCASGELTQAELTEVLGQSQPRVARHLRILCDAGLLDRFTSRDQAHQIDIATLDLTNLATIPDQLAELLAA